MHRIRIHHLVSLAALPMALSSPHALGDDPTFFSWSHQLDAYNSPAAQAPASGSTLLYTYCPQPGGGHNWGLGGTNGYVSHIWDEMESIGYPVALLMRERNSPWGSAPTWDLYDMTYPTYGYSPTPDPAQLAHAMVDRALNHSQLNYVLCDLETNADITTTDIDTWMGNIMDMVTGADAAGVTGDPYGTGPVNIAQAKIQSWDTVYVGNYRTHRYPIVDLSSNPDVPSGSNTYTNITAVWGNQAQSTGITAHHNRFVNLDMNVIMPVTYANCAQVRHVDQDPFSSAGDHWSGDHSPTQRAAFMWCGVEAYSAPVREEIASGTLTDKKVIPWVTPLTGYQDPLGATYPDCWMPPSADFLATIKHLRLRGADGFYFWGSGHLDPGGWVDSTNWSRQDVFGNYLNPWYDASEDWADASAPLNGYDWFEKHALLSWEELDGDFADDAVPYRLETDKSAGVIVSAMNDKGRLSILASYMKHTRSGLGVVFDLDNLFPEARDYSSGTTQYINLTGYSHVYEQNFFTPDIDGDYDSDGDDASAWVALYTAGDTRADWNRDGIFDATDISLFANAASNYP